MAIVLSAGYFTCASYLLYRTSGDLERRLGHPPKSLDAGWTLLSPRVPIRPENIDLRGSTRWPDGRLKDGRMIGDVLAERTDVAEAQRKVARYFDQGLDRRPAKILPNSCPLDYPPAETGVPQFKLLDAIEWVVVASVDPGAVLSPADIVL